VLRLPGHPFNPSLNYLPEAITWNWPIPMIDRADTNSITQIG
jgi:hypothetical protein